MSDSSRIYLDNAATSFPKPESVYRAVESYNRHSGVAVGRGAYRMAIETGQTISRCRKQVADLLGAESSDRIAFTFNGTDSLNSVIQGLLDDGDHVVTSNVEHNSVLRPLQELRIRRQVEVTHLPGDKTGRVDAAEFRAAIRPNTKLVALIHASNVTGVIQPIADVGVIARDAGVPFLVDAAQTAGHFPINLRELPIDFLACPGHKGLLGPLGTGVLYVRPGMENRLRSFRQGGTGSNSEDDQQPSFLPDKYESGNHNAPGLFGLEAGVAFLLERGVRAIRSHEQELTRQLSEKISHLAGVTIHGRSAEMTGVGVVSITVDGFEPQILAGILDENFQIQVRAGLHCAPGVHRCLQTLHSGGTVRLSVGPFTTHDEIDAAACAFKEISQTV